jgi:hypothetical protein
MAIGGLAKRQVTAMLETAGVEVGGSRPHDIQVHDERTYRRMALEGTLGIGESYMDGWWDCERLDEMATRVLSAAPGGKIRPAWPSLVLGAKARLLNLQKPSRALHVGKRHYDIGNDLYDPWTHRYIFPNGMVPSLRQLGEACNGLFLAEDLHGFGQDYDPTLLAWHRNLAGWEGLERYGERFRRMWSYYLLTAAASFRTRRLQVWQLVLAKDRGVPGGYVPVR